MAPANNWLHSLFSQVDIYLNGTTPSTNMYPYHAYIETLLSYGSEAKETQLTSQLWYKDTGGRKDAVNIVDEDVMNRGLVSRRAHVTQSRVVDMMGRLHVDLFLQDRYLLNGVDDFRDGYTFFGFDLTPDACDGSCFLLVQKGNLPIEMHFAAALQQTINVVVYAEFESVLENDKSRNVIYDF